MSLSLALASYGALTAWLLPITVRVAYDPSIQYMLASLAWFRGTPYAYTDHPGTPVEVLGSLLLLASHPFIRHASELIDFHLAQPQYFLSLAQSGLVLASMAVGVLLGRHAVAVDHWAFGLLAVALAGLYFAVHPLAFASLAEWSHESFNFPAGTAYGLGLLVVLRRPHRPAWRWVATFGFGAGVLSSVQLYFAAWVVGAALAVGLATRRQGATRRVALGAAGGVVAAAVAGFIVATLPIRDRYGIFADWVWRLTTHQETYGGGPQGFSTPDLLRANAFAEFEQAPLLLAALAIAAAVLVWRLNDDVRHARRGLAAWSVGLGLTCQSLVIVVLAAKHPGLKYLLPLAATLPVLLAAALDDLQVTPGTVGMAAVLGMLGLVALAASLWGAATRHVALAASLARGDQAIAAVQERVAADHATTRAELRTLWTYGTSSACYALWFGDETTGQAFTADIGRWCPRDLNLSVFSEQELGPGAGVPVGQLVEWDLAFVPDDIVRTRPGAMPHGTVSPTSIPSLGFGDLDVFVNGDRQPRGGRGLDG